MKREENSIRRLQMAAQCVNKQISISEMAIKLRPLAGQAITPAAFFRKDLHRK